jgi:hypothetical protein
MILVNPMLASHARIMGFTWLDWESPGFRGYAHMFTSLISTGENKTRTTADKDLTSSRNGDSTPQFFQESAIYYSVFQKASNSCWI